ncbi:hypothetical protein [Fodinicurvata sediminis]|uniref:hypothetical protein n=1 Tax=Fodinicurvata sediminis TaxID=1121832 RepID=UPI0003B78367|nr:hypothetical protein [Fodinicurvata sediminis]
MTDINHFQTYSQRENHVTNNTLLMLRHVYRLSPFKLEQILNSMVGEEVIEVGPRFTQQRRAAYSVPDCVIEQASFHIYVEAKLDCPLSEQQLDAHLLSIHEHSHKKGSAFLVGLAPEALPEEILKRVQSNAAEFGIQFSVVSFAELLSGLQEVCEDEPELEDILNDYHSFIANEGLLPDQHEKLVAFLCGTSWHENITHGVYYEPASRNPKWAQAHLIGTYKDKCITHIGRIKAVAICQRGGKGLEVLNDEFGELKDEDHYRIEAAIDGAAYYYPDFAQEPHRFYVVESFFEANLNKASSGGMLGHRYFNLVKDFNIDLDKFSDIEAIAEELSNKTFS